jgi:hypothetical protein
LAPFLALPVGAAGGSVALTDYPHAFVLIGRSPTPGPIMFNSKGMRFSEKAIEANGVPEKVTIDKSGVKK